MKLLKKVLGCVLAFVCVGGTVNVCASATAQATEVGGGTLTDIVLDESKFASTTTAVTYSTACFSVNKTGYVKEYDVSNANVGGVIRIGLGGMDLSGATSFQFLVNTSVGMRLKFGFIDKNGMANINHKDGVGYSNLSYTDFATKANTPAVATDYTYLGALATTGKKYVNLEKALFTEHQEVKTGAGYFWWYGYSNATTSVGFDWTQIDSVFMEITSMDVSTTGSIQLFSVSAVTATGTTEIVNAGDLKKIEKPTYNATESGYAKNDVSFGSRPTFTTENTCFSAPTLTKQGFSASGEIKADNPAFVSFVPSGEGKDLTNYGGMTFWVDASENTSDVTFKMIMKDDDGKNYFGDSFCVRIPDEGEKEIIGEEAEIIPAGFKGKIYIPFVNFNKQKETEHEESVYYDTATRTAARAIAVIDSTEAFRINLQDVTFHVSELYQMQSELTAFTEGFKLEDGASIRISEGDYGLRFKVNVDKDSYEALVAKAKTLKATVEIGAYLATTSTLNGAALTEVNKEAEVVPKKWAVENTTFFATLGYTDLQGKLDVAFTVRGYLKISCADGGSEIVYTEQVSRSTTEVATAVAENFQTQFSAISPNGKTVAWNVLKSIVPTLADSYPVA